MSLNWHVGNIKDHKTLCFVGEGDKARLHGVTYSLIHATMAVDLGVITEKNLEEWLWRLEFLRVIGKGDWLLEEAGARSFTAEEVRAHVGLRTNVIDTKRPAFLKRWVKVLEMNVDDTLTFRKRKAATAA